MDIQYSLTIPLSKLNQSLELKKKPITYLEVVAILRLYLSPLVEELYIEILIMIIPKFKRRNIWNFFLLLIQ